MVDFHSGFDRFRNHCFFVPLGIGAYLEKWSVSNKQIYELEWGQDQMIGEIRIIFTPNRHYSG